MKRLLSREDAFTGLEAAIVLIAFVVVAAVFSYVVLGAGFFSTQKSQEAVHTGVQQASSSFEILGDVYGVDTGAGKVQINYLNFTIGLAPGGMPIDMSKLTMVYANQSVRNDINQSVPLIANTNPAVNQWAIARVINGNNNALLEGGEQMDIVVHLAESTGSIAARDTFTLEIKPIIGPALSISRTAPGGIDPVNKLY
ncbi:MAG TPA: archaellin/type IV pilin N-terminal domain-containing protein [Methanomicrobiales archaeon]|nr:archaellin/type IV pilin N-terminal domain-containing protein [Methanomicrobiales archaeon]